MNLHGAANSLNWNRKFCLLSSDHDCKSQYTRVVSLVTSHHIFLLLYNSHDLKVGSCGCKIWLSSEWEQKISTCTAKKKSGKYHISVSHFIEYFGISYVFKRQNKNRQDKEKKKCSSWNRVFHQEISETFSFQFLETHLVLQCVSFDKPHAWTYF